VLGETWIPPAGQAARKAAWVPMSAWLGQRPRSPVPPPDLTQEDSPVERTSAGVETVHTVRRKPLLPPVEHGTGDPKLPRER